MGVQGLWKLLSPAGRRIKIETLGDKVLAIDVSIWLLKMIHGYLSLGSDEFRNIHLSGIFRRIVKLLFYGIKPVFVFDGKFPELKRETVARRQEARERRKVNLKKVAEKFLTKVLEERIKESVGRIIQPKRMSQSPKKTNRGREALPNIFDQEMDQEEEKVFDNDTQVFDYEFDYIVDENKELLMEEGVDLEEFYLQDTETQYQTIKKVKNKMMDRKIKKYLEIDSLDDLSKMHIKDYVNHIQRKNKLEKTKEETYSKRLTQEHELVMTNSKFKDIMSSQYMKNFFSNSNKEVVHGSLASDRTKGFIYMTQKNDQYDTQMLKVEKKKGNKNEKLKRLSKQLREIAQNAENAPQLFTFDELLCDNPLEAFKHSSKGIDSAVKGSLQKDSAGKEAEKKPAEESRTNVDVDEVFGFYEWGQNEETQGQDSKPAAEGEEKVEADEKKGGVFEQCDDNSNLEDLFEFNVEEYNSQDVEKKAEQAPAEEEEYIEQNAQKTDLPEAFKDSGLDELKSKIAKLKEEMLEEMQKKAKQSQKTEEVNETPRINVVSTRDAGKGREDIKEQIIKRHERAGKDSKGKEAIEKKVNMRVRDVSSEEETYYEPEEEVFDKKGASSKEKEEDSRAGEKIEDEEDDILIKRKRKDSDEEEMYYEPKEEFFKMNDMSFRGEEVEKAEIGSQSNEGIGEFKKEKEHMQIEHLEKEDQDIFELESSKSPEKTTYKVFELQSQEDNIIKRSLDRSREESKDGNWSERLNQNSKGVSQQKKDEEMEISLYKGPGDTNENNLSPQKETSHQLGGLHMASQGSGLDFAEDQFFDNFDEDRLINEMKELDDTENLDKWTLMQEFQRFQNLSEFEAGSIQEKFQEIKELLILFGIPWVESPAEAEAQCSFLEQNKLIDGIITDDSDVFLFGGNNVYRNIFEKGDYAHAFKMGHVEQDLGLDREKLILLALFLGSDYTLGIRGVGIVNAIEIVRAFDTVEALKRFKDWAELPDVLLENASEHYRNVPQRELDYKLYHRNFKKHWELPDEFPDKRVIEAYKNPTVDHSLEKFQWGAPDFASLKRYCETRLKWDEVRIFNLLEPLKKAINDRGNQKKITDYFREEKIATVNSKRMNEAIKHLKQKEPEEPDMPATITKSIESIIEKQNPRNIKKRKTGDYANEMIKKFAFDKKKVKKNN